MALMVADQRRSATDTLRSDKLDMCESISLSARGTSCLSVHSFTLLTRGPSCSILRIWDAVQVVVDIDGDGSFLMNCQELATAAIEKMDIKMFILNNQHLGMVVQWEDRFYKVCPPVNFRMLTSTACMSRPCLAYPSHRTLVSSSAAILLSVRSSHSLSAPQHEYHLL